MEIKKSGIPWRDGAQASLGIGLLVLFVAVASLVVIHISQNSKTHRLCKEWLRKVLIEAKADPPEYGIYEATLPVSDLWETPLLSALTVEQYSNSVIVLSAGRDMEYHTDDDFVHARSDIHKRKVIAKALEEGSTSIGKGFAKGVIEGIGEATNASVATAKSGAAKVKGKLMAHFRKKEETEN